MNISVILAHPNPKSFNHAIAKSVLQALKENGHAVYYHDLYAEKFQDISLCQRKREHSLFQNDIKTYCVEISVSEGIVVVHPDWGGQPPVILKAWIDRVIFLGANYILRERNGGEITPERFLKAKAVFIFNTSNAGLAKGKEVFDDPLARLWHGSVFGHCGLQFFHRETFRVIGHSSSEQRRRWLRNVEEIIAEYFPEFA